MRNMIKVTALLHAALALTGICAAQTSTSRLPIGLPQETTKIAQPSAIAQQEDNSQVAPVFWITSVEVMSSAHGPKLDLVRVRGLVTAEGWESAELMPMTAGIPSDGILELALVAEAPSESARPTSFSEVEAVFAMEPGHPFNGVRVHGAANRVVVKTLPGYAESATPPKNCADCTGKLFVAKGQTVPAGHAAKDIVHEEELPNTLRVIHESSGIGSMDLDPTA